MVQFGKGHSYESRRRTLFDQAKRQDWRELSDEALLAVTFEASDPENLVGITEELPPEGEPFVIEFGYDMRERGAKVRCVYCKWENHFVGVVVNYQSGRRLVGRICAVNHHGARFEALLRDFDAGRERQDYVRRKRAVLEAGSDLLAQMAELRAHPSVGAFADLRWTWRNLLANLWTGLTHAAHGDGMLAFDKKVRDHAAEDRLAEKQGLLTKWDRKQAFARGEFPRLHTIIPETVGPLNGLPFFRSGESVGTRLEEIEAEMKAAFAKLAREEPKTADIRNALLALDGLKARIEEELGRLRSVLEAFEPDNLLRVAAWANGRAARETPAPSPSNDTMSVLAHMTTARPVDTFGTYEARDRTFTRRDGWERWSVTLPEAYHVPRTKLVESLAQAIAVDRPTLKEEARRPAA